MIQFNAFHDGGFVLHKVMLNGHKYSAWFSADGRAIASERFSANGMKSFHVPLDRQANVKRQLETIGARYRQS